MNKLKLIILVFLAVVIFVLPHILFLVTDYNFSYYSLVVDENENVYLSTKNKIVVYNNNKYIYSIDTSEYDSFRFAVHNGKILIYSEYNCFLIDKTGKKISMTSEEFIGIRDNVYFNSSSFSNGEKTYELIERKGKTKVLDLSDKRVVYEISKEQYYARLFFKGCMIASFILIYIVVTIINKIYLENPPLNSKIRPFFKI